MGLKKEISHPKGQIAFPEKPVRSRVTSEHRPVPPTTGTLFRSRAACLGCCSSLCLLKSQPSPQLPGSSGSWNQSFSVPLASLLEFLHHCFSRSLALVCWGCCDSAGNWVTLTTKIHCLTALEARSSRARCRQGWCPLKL